MCRRRDHYAGEGQSSIKQDFADVVGAVSDDSCDGGILVSPPEEAVLNLRQFWKRQRLRPLTLATTHCQARIGLDMFCTNRPRDGSDLCSFHENLVGPWAKPNKLFSKF